MFKNLSIFNKDNKKITEFSKINVIFGYSKSGKTTILSNLNNIFIGKDRHNLVNGTQTIPGDFNVFYLGTKDGIKDHLKLSSKSLLRKMILENQFSEDFSNCCNQISKSINRAQLEIEDLVRSVLPGIKIEINDSDNPLELLMDNMNISLEMDTTSEEKEELFSLVNALSKTTKNQTIVLIDDFNNDLDEETTLNFFEEIEKSQAIFILTTKKPIPQYLVNDNFRIFASRNFGLLQLPNLEKMALDSQNVLEEAHTFEEYMLGMGYLKESQEYRNLLELIKNDEYSNIFRMLTSKNPVVSNKYQKGHVTIIGKTEQELKLYNYILNLISSNHQ